MKLLEIDPKTGKYKLSHRVLIEKPADYVERPARRERGERPERGERRPRPERGERRDRRPRPETEQGEQVSEKPVDESSASERKDFSDALDHMDL